MRCSAVTRLEVRPEKSEVTMVCLVRPEVTMSVVYPLKQAAAKPVAVLSTHQCVLLTRAPLGGGWGANITPLPDLLDSSKTAADIDAKLSVPFPPSI